MLLDEPESAHMARWSFRRAIFAIEQRELAGNSAE